MTYQWLLKIKRYDGSESVIASCASRESAQAHADRRNQETQSQQFYVEEYSPKRAEGFSFIG